jgi:hypothetical protein
MMLYNYMIKVYFMLYLEAFYGRPTGEYSLLLYSSRYVIKNV